MSCNKVIPEIRLPSTAYSKPLHGKANSTLRVSINHDSVGFTSDTITSMGDKIKLHEKSDVPEFSGEMNKYFLSRIICFLEKQSCLGQKKNERAMKIVQTAVDSIGIPSLSASVHKNGALVFDFAYGVKDVVSKLPVSTDDPYHIGSITKSMTATMIGYLVEEDKLSWDTKIIDVFPDLDSLQVDYSHTTLTELLSHSSGLVDLFNAEDWSKMVYDSINENQQRMELMINSLTNKNNVRRGKDWNYANVNYAIASLMASKVSNLSWKKLMQIYIADKVGISMGYGWAKDTDKKKVPKGHVKFTDKYEIWGPNDPHKIPVTIQPAGDIHMTVSDLSRYGYFHIMGLHEGINGLSRENFKILHEPLLGNYALGWNVVPDGTKNLPELEQHQHLGSGGTFHSVIAIFPENNVSIAIAHNGGGNIVPIGFVLANLGKIFLSQE